MIDDDMDRMLQIAVVGDFGDALDPVVHEIPYQALRDPVIEKIADQVDEKKIGASPGSATRAI